VVGEGRVSERQGLQYHWCWNFNQARCAKTAAHAMAERGTAACTPSMTMDWAGAAI